MPATNAGPRGTALEVTGLGLNNGDATVYLNSWDSSGDPVAEAYRLDKAYSSGGIAKVTVDTTTQNFVPGTEIVVKSGKETLVGLNEIYIVDASGKHINPFKNRARFEITPLIELDGDTFKRGGKVNITVSDWVYGNLHTIQIGGVTVGEVPDGSDTQPWTSKYGSRTKSDEGLDLGIDEVEFEFIVPNSARLGEQELKLISHSRDRQGKIGDQDFAKGKILIGAFDLTIEPSTAVTDQVIKIEGSGFGRDACIIDILVGDERVVESTSGNRAGSWVLDANGVATTTRTCGPGERQG